MDATRLRLGPAADWAVALVFFAATVGVAGLIVHELTAIGGSPTLPARTTEPAAPPTSLPSLSIPVSVLPLPGGEELRLGESAAKVSRVLGKDVRVGVEAVEQGRLGDRITRSYEYGSIRFTLVLERFERNGELRIAAIYVR